jgi:hypothetical protein
MECPRLDRHGLSSHFIGQGSPRRQTAPAGRFQKRSRLAEGIQGLGTLCLEATPVKQHADFFSLQALIGLAVAITQSHSSLLYVRSELVCSRLETASLDCLWITGNPKVIYSQFLVCRHS